MHTQIMTNPNNYLTINKITLLFSLLKQTACRLNFKGRSTITHQIGKQTNKHYINIDIILINDNYISVTNKSLLLTSEGVIGQDVIL